MEVVEIILIIVAIFLAALGIIGCIAPVLPGPIISYLSLIALHFGVEGGVSRWILIVMLVLTLLVSLLDYLMPAYTTKRFGGTKYGIWGGLIGLFIGLFIPPWGIVFGPLLGAILGDLIAGKQFQHALKSGVGAFLGLVFATLIKLSVSIAIAVVLIIYIGKDLVHWIRMIT